MSENNDTKTQTTDTSKIVSEKLSSSQKHAQQVIETTKKAAKAAFEAGKEQVTAAYAEGKEHARAAASDFGEAASAKYQEVRSQVKSATDQYYNRAQEVISEANVRLRTLRDDGEQYVRENPLQAVGIALAVGFVLGLLVRR